MILIEGYEEMSDVDLVLALVHAGVYDRVAAETVVAIERGRIVPEADL